MKTRIIFALTVASFFATSYLHGVEVPDAVKHLAESDFADLASDPIIVQAIKDQNALGASLDDVKSMDKKWMDTPGVADFMKALIDSAAGVHLKEWRSQHAYVSEIIVMDHQGANVALIDKTSDYWQGDEKKFTESAQGGGRVFIGDVKFDDSTQTYSVQVSVPVVSDGSLIGVVCLGVDVEEL